MLITIIIMQIYFVICYREKLSIDHNTSDRNRMKKCFFRLVSHKQKI